MSNGYSNSYNDGSIQFNPLCTKVLRVKSLNTHFNLLCPKEVWAISFHSLSRLQSVNHPAVVEGENGVTPPSGNGTTAWHDVRKMIFVRPKTTGFWPIPESFWPDAATQVLVSSHSNV